MRGAPWWNAGWCGPPGFKIIRPDVKTSGLGWVQTPRATCGVCANLARNFGASPGIDNPPCYSRYTVNTMMLLTERVILRLPRGIGTHVSMFKFSKKPVAMPPDPVLKEGLQCPFQYLPSPQPSVNHSVTHDFVSAYGHECWKS